VLIDGLVVAYYTWYDEQTIVSAIIETDDLNLYVTNVKTGESTKYASYVGRSFHRIPNSNLVSFISKEDNQSIIKSLDPLSGKTNTIIETIGEDICWLPDGSILTSTKNTIYRFDPKKDEAFTVFKAFNDDNLQNITRMATNEKGTLLALVSEIQQ
jgi:streptogramin lyase